MDLDDEWLNFQENGEISENCSKTQEKKVQRKIPKCSNIYISTQTKIAYLSEKIDLNDIFWKLKTIPYQNPEIGIIKKSIKINNIDKNAVKLLDEKIKNDSRIQCHIINHIDDPTSSKIKYKDVRKITVGLCSKDIISFRKKQKGAFYNCFALIIRLKYKNIFKEVHVKVFNTGKLEIPGIQHDDLLIITIGELIKILQPHFKKTITYKNTDIQTVLINSNFSSGFYINRNIFHDILKYKYNLDVMYDPCSYPGIQSKFYFNKKNKIHNGMCKCEKKCEKKKKDKTKNNCTEVSFMIFRTGSILIVGNCNKTILLVVYNFLKQVLIDEFEKIYIMDNNVKKEIKKKRSKKNVLFTIK
jgi:TATA-box binding protein (TBP) (component of TFIID and TFIIIB)